MASCQQRKQPLCAAFRKIFREKMETWNRLRFGRGRLLERPAADLITLPPTDVWLFKSEDRTSVYRELGEGFFSARRGPTFLPGLSRVDVPPEYAKWVLGNMVLQEGPLIVVNVWRQEGEYRVLVVKTNSTPPVFTLLPGPLTAVFAQTRSNNELVVFGQNRPAPLPQKIIIYNERLEPVRECYCSSPSRDVSSNMDLLYGGAFAACTASFYMDSDLVVIDVDSGERSNAKLPFSRPRGRLIAVNDTTLGFFDVGGHVATLFLEPPPGKAAPRLAVRHAPGKRAALGWLK